jgi:hypothetical protein
VRNADTELAARSEAAAETDSQADSSIKSVAQFSPGSAAAKPLNTTSLLLAALKGWLSSLFKKVA